LIIYIKPIAWSMIISHATSIQLIVTRLTIILYRLHIHDYIISNTHLYLKKKFFFALMSCLHAILNESCPCRPYLCNAIFFWIIENNNKNNKLFLFFFFFDFYVSFTCSSSPFLHICSRCLLSPFACMRCLSWNLLFRLPRSPFGICPLYL
jgi:hypothetical protein